VNQALALHSLADARLDEQIDRARFKNAGPDAFLAILAGSVLENNRIDSFEMKEVREHETGRTGSHNPNLRP